jgi:hypothetical protein
VSQQRFMRANVNPQDVNRTNPGAANRGVLAPAQPGHTGQPGTTIQRFQGNPQTNVAPSTQGQPGSDRFRGNPQINTPPGAPTILRGGSNPQPPTTGNPGQPQGQRVDPRFHGQMGNETVVPQTHTVVPQHQPAQPRVVAPPPQNRGVEQDRRLPGAGGTN